MRNLLSHIPFLSLAMLFAACSGEGDAEPIALDDGQAELARDSSDRVDADRHGRQRPEERRRGRRHRHHHHQPGGDDPGEPPPVACAAILEVSDGVCSRPADDPCISQDPDCTPGPACDVAGQNFPDGSPVPSGDSCNGCSCNDGSVICTLALCEPVACAAFVEQPDGVCSRFPLDPCKSQDPDCIEPATPAEPTDPTAPAAPTEPAEPTAP